jgi:hypothetical protein
MIGTTKVPRVERAQAASAARSDTAKRRRAGVDGERMRERNVPSNPHSSSTSTSAF